MKDSCKYERAFNKRVPCVCKVRTAYILYNSRKCGPICIGTISEEMNDAEEKDWVFKINWSNYDKAGKPDICGIDTSLRLNEYIRCYVPAFVDYRSCSDRRENLEEELRSVGLDHNDRFEFMVRTHGVSNTDDVYVGRTESDFFGKTATR